MRVLQALAFVSLNLLLTIVESIPLGPSSLQSSENFFDDARRARRRAGTGTFPMPETVARRTKISKESKVKANARIGALAHHHVASPTEPNERGKGSQSSTDEPMVGRSDGPEEDIVPRQLGDDSVVLFPDFDVPQLLFGSPFCELEIEKPQYTEEQKQCVKSRIDTNSAYEYINLVQSEEFTLALRVILVNPLGLPKLSFLNFAKAIIALLCGGSGVEALNKAFGIETVLKILEGLGKSIQVIIGIAYTPLSLLEGLKVFSWIPKIGAIFGNISKIVRPAYRKMAYLEEQADEKCAESGRVLNFINLFFKVRPITAFEGLVFDFPVFEHTKGGILRILICFHSLLYFFLQDMGYDSIWHCYFSFRRR